MSDAATNCDNYHVRLNFLSNPGEQYAFSVGRGSCSAVNTSVECNDYRWATDLRISDAGVLTGQCPCHGGAGQPPTQRQPVRKRHRRLLRRGLSRGLDRGRPDLRPVPARDQQRRL
jgi:hypothetical protein